MRCTIGPALISRKGSDILTKGELSSTPARLPFSRGRLNFFKGLFCPPVVTPTQRFGCKNQPCGKGRDLFVLYLCCLCTSCVLSSCSLGHWCNWSAAPFYRVSTADTWALLPWIQPSCFSAFSFYSFIYCSSRQMGPRNLARGSLIWGMGEGWECPYC